MSQSKKKIQIKILSISCLKYNSFYFSLINFFFSFNIKDVAFARHISIVLYFFNNYYARQYFLFEITALLVPFKMTEKCAALEV